MFSLHLLIWLSSSIRTYNNSFFILLFVQFINMIISIRLLLQFWWSSDSFSQVEFSLFLLSSITSKISNNIHTFFQECFSLTVVQCLQMFNYFLGHCIFVCFGQTAFVNYFLYTFSQFWFTSRMLQVVFWFLFPSESWFLQQERYDLS